MLQYVSDKMQFNTFLNERKPSQNLSTLCLVEALTLYLLQSSVTVIGSVDTGQKRSETKVAISILMATFVQWCFRRCAKIRYHI